MWRRRGDSTILGPEVSIVSTWHDTDILESSLEAYQITTEWELDLQQIRKADVLLAYAEFNDRPNGTLVEIGYALGHEMPIYLVGNFRWGTWRYLPNVHPTASLREAVIAITTGAPEGAPEGSSTHDPS
jgi:hypothetical protein